MNKRLIVVTAFVALPISADFSATQTYPNASRILQPTSPGTGISASRRTKPEMQHIASIGVPFIPNRGQLKSDVKFYAKVLNGTLFVTKDGTLVYVFRGKPANAGVAQGLSISERLAGTDKINVSTGNAAETRVNIFHSNDPNRWQHALQTYTSLSFGDVYKGIEMELLAHMGNVEKRFHIQPDADPGEISLEVLGAENLSITGSGQLEAITKHGPVRFSCPIAWQDIDGKRINIAVRYVIDSHKAGHYGFQVARYDTRYPLVIDPLLQSTYLAGSTSGEAYGAAIHPTNGDIYIVGQTGSSDFPGITGSSADSVFTGSSDGFIARVSSNLQTLTQTTYLGGSDTEYIQDIAIHPVSGDIYVTGWTRSDDFPGVTDGADTTRAGMEGFVSRLSSNLQTLGQSTYLGGSSDDTGYGIAIHPTSGDIYVTGNTFSDDFPKITGGADVTRLDTEGFISRLSNNLTAINQSTYIGGSKPDVGSDIAIHPTSGNIYVTGVTYSTDFPGVTGGADSALGGTQDAFAVLLPNDLQSVIQATYLGGSDAEIDSGTKSSIAIHPTNGQIYVAGTTKSSDFPGISGGADSSFGGDREAFVLSLASDLKSLTQSSFLGGNNKEYGYSVSIHPASGDIYVAGHTYSSDFPGISGGDDATFDSATGSIEGFISRLDDKLQTLSQSTFLGGSYLDFVQALAIHPVSGNIYATGSTWSSDFPKTANGADPTRSASSNAPYVSVFDSLTSASNPGSLEFSVADYTVNEDGGTATINVSRSGGSNGTVSVQYDSFDNTATDTQDYTAVSDTLTWINGDNSDKTFEISIIDDATKETEESINLVLSIPTGGAILGAQNTATLTITDNDDDVTFYVIPIGNGKAVVFGL